MQSLNIPTCFLGKRVLVWKLFYIVFSRRDAKRSRTDLPLSLEEY